MSKIRTTLTIDDEVLKLVKVQAARRGMRDSEVIEESLRRDLGLELLDRLWSRSDLTEKQAMSLALEAQRAIRQQ